MLVRLGCGLTRLVAMTQRCAAAGSKCFCCFGAAKYGASATVTSVRVDPKQSGFSADGAL